MQNWKNINTSKTNEYTKTSNEVHINKVITVCVGNTGKKKKSTVLHSLKSRYISTKWQRFFFFHLILCHLQYRVSIKSFPDYKHLLQENYVEYKHIFFSKCNSTQKVFLQHISTLQQALLLLHGERITDNQFLSTCSPTCLQLL